MVTKGHQGCDKPVCSWKSFVSCPFADSILWHINLVVLYSIGGAPRVTSICYQ
uniref:Uncharacterized protein n=1 Tax=Rhizophora mucronata TaxID=61149 RepID=A0A2P2N3P0_RHIMU